MLVTVHFRERLLPDPSVRSITELSDANPRVFFRTEVSEQLWVSPASAACEDKQELEGRGETNGGVGGVVASNRRYQKMCSTTDVSVHFEITNSKY